MGQQATLCNSYFGKRYKTANRCFYGTCDPAAAAATHALQQAIHYDTEPLSGLLTADVFARGSVDAVQYYR